jgi:AdoMet-dependent rRNA methyltransferase SPB1
LGVRGQKRRRNREGYEDGSMVLYKEAPALTLVQAPDPVLVLSSYNALTFDDAPSAAYGVPIRTVSRMSD